MFMTAHEKPTVEFLAQLLRGKIGRSGQDVIVGFRGRGYLIVEPADYDGPEGPLPAARIRGRMRRKDKAGRRLISIYLQSANIRTIDDGR